MYQRNRLGDTIMALASYTDLLAQVAGWIGRSDLTANIPDFVTLFEAIANRRLRVRQMEAVLSFTTNGGRAPLPADYLAWRRMTWAGNTSVDMKYRTPSGLRIMFPTFAAGIPSTFTIEPTTIITADEDDVTVDDDDIVSTWQIVTADTDDSDSAFAFHYYRKIPVLSGGLNWLMNEHPDAYLYGVLTEAYGFQKDIQNMALWAARRDEIFADIMKLDTKTRGPSAIMVAGATP
jgi:hypothetical protein